MATTDRPRFPEPPTHCDDCGVELLEGHAFELAGGRRCLGCSAVQACSILDLNGPAHVTQQDIADAAAVLATYSRIGAREKLARFAGRCKGTHGTELAPAP